MQIILALTITVIVACNVALEDTKDYPRDDKHTIKTKIDGNDQMPANVVWNSNTIPNSFLSRAPVSRTGSEQEEDYMLHREESKTPPSLTRLAKTITLGLHPYFHKSQGQSKDVKDLKGCSNRPCHWKVQKSLRVDSEIRAAKKPNESQLLRGYFEPFEKRPKPVTLVGMRKNGLFPRKSINLASQSGEIAELQSPYNEVSNFWVEDHN